MFSNGIVLTPNLILKDSNTDSETDSLIRLSLLDNKKTCSSNGVLSINQKPFLLFHDST